MAVEKEQRIDLSPSGRVGKGTCLQVYLQSDAERVLPPPSPADHG